MVAITSFKSRRPAGRAALPPNIRSFQSECAGGGAAGYRYIGAATDQIVMTLRET